MAYTKYVYSRVNWKNKSESLETPLGKTNLNRMDDGIHAIAENLDVVYSEMDAKKLDTSLAGKMLTELPTWDNDTGILTFKFYDGTEFSVDFNIEKIPVSFSMDSTGLITMTTADGTQWTASIGEAIPTYAFIDSDTIAFTDDKSGDYAHSIKAEIKKHSVTQEHMQPDYLADITAQASLAKGYRDQALQSVDDSAFNALMAQSYAIGGTSVREGEDEDNAKYYSGLSKNYAEKASQILDFKLPSFHIDAADMHLYGDFDKMFVFTLGDDGHLYTDLVSA